VALDPLKLITFVLTLILLSFSTPGIPSGSNGSTFGAYLAAGLPAEGVLIFDAVDSLTDIFRTLVNVTGSLAAAVIAARFARPQPIPQPAEEALAWSSS
jgi:Na+/H+-dicarboxylate symporter